MAVGYFVRNYLTEIRSSAAGESAKKILEGAEKEAEALKREAAVEAKDKVHGMRAEFERENKERRRELDRLDKRLSQKEEFLDSRSVEFDRKEKALADKASQADEIRQELEKVHEEQKSVLQNIAGMSAEEAKDFLLRKIEDEAKHEAAALIKEIETQTKEEAEKRARKIVTLAIQRVAADQVAETTVSVVPLPGDEMKGRIIGREGRNIRAFETLTGINLIIDDTPEAVILSSFDPIRRETARLTLEKLIADGRIHPARIEEMYEKSKQEVDTNIREEGERASIEADTHRLHAELVRALGRLSYRTSYGQNVLQHSMEVSHLAGIMASELGIDVKRARRAGLLHDVGKAIDHEVEGPHATIGADLAKRLGESGEICEAIGGHHGESDHTTMESVLIQAADAVSGARPGARRETLESYIKRLEKLETIAQTQKGVEKCYAMQAGREIRIMVKPDDVDDGQTALLARDIAKRIEDELEYPGQIKVTVIRENRSVEYAR